LHPRRSRLPLGLDDVRNREAILMMPTTAQIHGIVRFIMTVTGTILASFGFAKLSLTSDQANQLGTLLEAFVGTVLPLASFVWNMKAHSPSGLGAHLADLKDK
jgi:uncharacterized membrane protein YeaQ/YmgE (transglycosylase-associated protein family)